MTFDFGVEVGRGKIHRLRFALSDVNAEEDCKIEGKLCAFTLLTTCSWGRSLYEGEYGKDSLVISISSHSGESRRFHYNGKVES